jgi:hypothetical protein
MKSMASAVFLAALMSISAAAQGLTPAQQNFKACPADAKQRGIQVVLPMCGEPPKKTVELPTYEEAYNSITASQLARYEEILDNLRNEVRRYQQCINSRVMSNGALPTATLDLAACADQYAVVDQLGELQEEWTLACHAHNFSENATPYPRECTPQAS